MIQILRVSFPLSVNRNTKMPRDDDGVLSSNSNQSSAGYPSVMPTNRNQEEILPSLELKSFAFNDLSLATRKFHPKLMLGQGGSGCVFKGWVDENTFTAAKWGSFIRNSRNLVIAVKRLNQGVQGYEKWLNVFTLQHLHTIVFLAVTLSFMFNFSCSNFKLAEQLFATSLTAGRD